MRSTTSEDVNNRSMPFSRPPPAYRRRLLPDRDRGACPLSLSSSPSLSFHRSVLSLPLQVPFPSMDARMLYLKSEPTSPGSPRFRVGLAFILRTRIRRSPDSGARVPYGDNKEIFTHIYFLILIITLSNEAGWQFCRCTRRAYEYLMDTVSRYGYTLPAMRRVDPC